MAEQFETGDVVDLKSGGPLMTVNRVNKDGDVICEWFNQEGQKYEPKWHAFKPQMLRRLKSKGSNT
ncbi:YodC family protein [Shinella yambaruensis]|uniref:DUF2158 domain-containing protein n=1 Tax=Shinella yambaruensis TaxID=415996 RepID=A0ABQ5ZQH0_9HYPH|nr:DUF2158 domain-containing protein [Shinella yambaruensis]GLR54330.1 hypothetical protein GCM10007923_55470 [Shinella yambaruensis]